MHGDRHHPLMISSYRTLLHYSPFRCFSPYTTVHPASKTKLDKHLATDPLGLAEEAIRQEWTDARRIVVQRGKLVYDWKVRIAKR